MNLTPEKLREILEKDRRASDEALFGVYEGPVGDQGRHRVKLENGTTIHEVGSAAPGVTFKPGTQVPILSPRAGSQRVIVGAPPPGRKGTAFPPATRTISQPAPITSSDFEFLSIHVSIDGTTLEAFRHDTDGSLIESLATVGGGLGSPEYASRIATDSESLVGDNSVVMVVEGTTQHSVQVFDVSDTTLYTYTPPSGWSVGTMAGYTGGYVYWSERELAGLSVRLSRARADLTSQSVLSTATITAFPDPESSWGGPTAGVLSESALLVGFSGTYDEDPVYQSARFPLTGAAAGTSSDAFGDQLFPTPISSTDAIGVKNKVSDQGNDLRQRADQANVSPTSPWPATTNWLAGTGEYGVSADLSSDGLTAMLYTWNGITNTAIVGDLTGATGDPDQRVNLVNGESTPSTWAFLYEVS